MTVDRATLKTIDPAPRRVVFPYFFGVKGSKRRVARAITRAQLEFSDVAAYAEGSHLVVGALVLAEGLLAATEVADNEMVVAKIHIAPPKTAAIMLDREVVQLPKQCSTLEKLEDLEESQLK